jgi:hypothetical protein
VTFKVYGAFLVSVSIAADGTVSPVSSATPVVKEGTGAAVPVTTVSPGVFSFATTAGGEYTISG